MFWQRRKALQVTGVKCILLQYFWIKRYRNSNSHEFYLVITCIPRKLYPVAQFQNIIVVSNSHLKKQRSSQAWRKRRKVEGLNSRKRAIAEISWIKIQSDLQKLWREDKRNNWQAQLWNIKCWKVQTDTLSWARTTQDIEFKVYVRAEAKHWVIFGTAQKLLRNGKRETVEKVPWE